MKRENKLNRSSTIQSYLMISGSLLALIVFVVLPLLWIMRFSVLSWRGFGEIKFVGLKNFVRVFSSTSQKYWLSVSNTFVFAIGKLLVEIPLALVLAFVLTRDLKGTTFFRSMYFMPSMISVAVMGVIFNYIFAHVNGVANEAIKFFGGQPIKWFATGTSAMIVLMIASIWQNFGINMLFFMTGLQSISPEMYEAAAIDGANNTRQFFTITIPLLGPVLQMVLMNAILGSLKVTDLVLTLTFGRPSGKTEVMMTYIYKRFFGEAGSSAMDYGFGAALTVVTAIILTIVTLIYLRATKKSSDVY
ncbi:MAG: sugar ABC transporter permease [Clostridia bacterium]|nr:sugar ABC transporter permease [Clostridia bacterium]